MQFLVGCFQFRFNSIIPIDGLRWNMMKLVWIDLKKNLLSSSSESLRVAGLILVPNAIALNLSPLRLWSSFFATRTDYAQDALNSPRLRGELASKIYQPNESSECRTSENPDQSAIVTFLIRETTLHVRDFSSSSRPHARPKLGRKSYALGWNLKTQGNDVF